MDESVTPGDEDGYTISGLEAETGLPRRTIHYYVQRDLLPPADGTGPNARYGPEHLLRLRLVALLKDSGLRLAGIRQILDGMTHREMEALAGSPDWDSAAGGSRLSAWLSARLADTDEGESAGRHRDDPAAYRAHRRVRERLASSVDDSATWRRLRPLAELEIHYRPGSGSAFLGKMKRLMAAIHEIFSEEIARQRERDEDE